MDDITCLVSGFYFRPTFAVPTSQRILFITECPILSNGQIHLHKLVLPAYFTCSPNILSVTSISLFGEINSILKKEKSFWDTYLEFCVLLI